jgi:hypothetical protein
MAHGCAGPHDFTCGGELYRKGGQGYELSTHKSPSKCVFLFHTSPCCNYLKIFRLFFKNAATFFSSTFLVIFVNILQNVAIFLGPTIFWASSNNFKKCWFSQLFFNILQNVATIFKNVATIFKNVGRKHTTPGRVARSLPRRLALWAATVELGGRCCATKELGAGRPW